MPQWCQPRQQLVLYPVTDTCFVHGFNQQIDQMVKVTLIDLHAIVNLLHAVPGVVTGTITDITQVPGQMFFETLDVGLGEIMENLLVAATNGGALSLPDATDKSLEILEDLGLGDLADVPASQLRLLDRKRLEMARALATEPSLLLLDEIAGGLTEDECETLVQTINDIRASGTSIIWIEHVVHALLAVVDRLVVINFGAVLAEGDPQETFNSKDVQEIYLGIEA